MDIFNLRYNKTKAMIHVKNTIITVLILLSFNLNSAEITSRIQQYGNYSQEVFNRSVTSSIPIYSPVPLHLLRKPLERCSNIGSRIHPIYRTKRQHNGIDLAVPKGTEIISTMAGKVVFKGNRGDGYGNQIVIESGEYLVKYAHLHKIKDIGEFVQFGEVIGLVGSTGQSTGNHLHYEIYRNGFLQNPLPYIRVEKSIFKK